MEIEIGDDLVRLLRWLDEYVEDSLCFLFYTYLVLIVFIEVVRRYVFNWSSSWSEETAIYAFIWMVYLAAAKGVKERSHLSVDFLVRLMGRRGQLVSSVLSDVCFVILAVVAIYYSVLIAGTHVATNLSMQGANLPLVLATAAVPVGWILILVRVVQRFINTIRAYAAGEDLGITRTVSE